MQWTTCPCHSLTVLCLLLTARLALPVAPWRTLNIKQQEKHCISSWLIISCANPNVKNELRWLICPFAEIYLEVGGERLHLREDDAWLVNGLYLSHRGVNRTQVLRCQHPLKMRLLVGVLQFMSAWTVCLWVNARRENWSDEEKLNQYLMQTKITARFSWVTE